MVIGVSFIEVEEIMKEMFIIGYVSVDNYLNIGIVIYDFYEF